MIAWVKALHICFLLLWCASLIYLPLLLARHHPGLQADDYGRLRVMTRFTYVAVASPAAILAILTGTALIALREVAAPWLAAKLACVAGMVLFQVYCGYVLGRQGHESVPGRYTVGAVRVIVPVVLILATLWLVLGKPSLLPETREQLIPSWLPFKVDSAFTPQLPSGTRIQACRPSSRPPLPTAQSASIDRCRTGKRLQQHRVAV